MRRNEWVGGVEASPENDTDVGVDEEFDEEEVAEVGLCRAWEGAEDAGGTAAEDCAFAGGDGGGCILGDLDVVLAIDEEACYEGTEDLREDVVGDFFPGESLPCSEAYCHCRVKVTAKMLGNGLC